jgi:hypothetical protein
MENEYPCTITNLQINIITKSLYKFGGENG